MQRRKFSREFKLLAVKLVLERGVSAAQAARDLDVHANVLRRWIREAEGDPGSAFPGYGNLRPEQQEIERLRRELARMKAERDILKKKSGGLLREGLDMRFAFIAKHRGIWPISWICEALGVSRSGFHAWLVRAPSVRTRSDEAFGARVRASFISQLSHLWRAPCLARSSGRRPFMRPAPRRASDAGAGSQGSPPAAWPAQG